MPNSLVKLLTTESETAGAGKEEASYVDDVIDYKPLYKVKYLVFPVGNRPYGGGGWSRRAKYRPLPEVVSVVTPEVTFSGKKVIVNGVTRLKCNVWFYGKPEKPLRIDYPDIPYEDAS